MSILDDLEIEIGEREVAALEQLSPKTNVDVIYLPSDQWNQLIDELNETMMYGPKISRDELSVIWNGQELRKRVI